MEEAESIFNRIARLVDSMFGDIRLNNEALFAITGPVRKVGKEVCGKTNREIADAMSALARKTVFMDALSELSKVTEFVFHVQKSIFREIKSARIR